MIQSRFNELNGWLTVWWEDRDESIPPAEVAENYRRYIVQAGAPKAMVGNEDPKVAAALVGFPGFCIMGEDYEYVRAWPSGIKGRDMSGVRVAGDSDVETISRILSASFGGVEGGFFSPTRVRAEMLNTDWFNILLTDGGAEVGYGSAIHDGRDGILNLVAVTQNAQGRGFGRKIMDILLVELDSVAHERIVLSVGGDNARAIGLYKRYGFDVSGNPSVNVKYEKPSG